MVLCDGSTRSPLPTCRRYPYDRWSCARLSEPPNINNPKSKIMTDATRSVDGAGVEPAVADFPIDPFGRALESPSPLRATHPLKKAAAKPSNRIQLHKFHEAAFVLERCHLMTQRLLRL